MGLKDLAQFILKNCNDSTNSDFNQIKQAVRQMLNTITTNGEKAPDIKTFIRLIRIFNNLEYAQDREQMSIFLNSIAKNWKINAFDMQTIRNLDAQQAITLFTFILKHAPHYAIDDHAAVTAFNCLYDKFGIAPEMHSLYKKTLNFAIKNDLRPSYFEAPSMQKVLKVLTWGKEDSTLLHKCVAACDLRWIKYLTDNCSELISASDNTGRSVLFNWIDLAKEPLNEDTKKQIERVFKLLKRSGVDINAPDAKGITPLMYALSVNHGFAATLLFGNYANLIAYDNNGMSTKHYATLCNYEYLQPNILRAIREIENTNNERPLNLVKNSWGSTATDLGSEDQVVLAYIENLRLAKGSEAARRLQGTTPFKISRVELNKHFQGKPNIQHSYLILPNHNKEQTKVAAILRGSLENEGIIGTGAYGKILKTTLQLDGKRYCIKVAPHNASSQKEFNIMKMVLQKLQPESYIGYFSRSEAERHTLHTGKANYSWLSNIAAPKIHDKAYIIQPFITAPSLHDFLKNTPGIKDNYDYMCSIATSLQQALSDLHAINITHNDLHDENIVVEFDVEKQAFKCQIIDFGLATDIFPDNKKLFQKDLRALYP